MSQDQPPLSEPTSHEASETSSESTLDAPLNEVERLTDAAIAEAAQTEAAQKNVSITEADAAQTEAKPSRRAASNERSTRARRPAPANDEILPQTLLRLLGEAVVAAQPPLKKQGIKTLRGTIQLLEKAVERLEAEPTPKQVRRRVPVPGQASEDALPPSSQTPTGKLVPPFSTAALREKFRTLRQQAWRSWRPLLRQIRDRLPTAINRNFSDQALTGAIAGILVILLWTVSSLLPAKPQPTTIAKAPPTETVAPPTPALTPTPAPAPIPPLVKAPEGPKPVEISPAPSKPAIPPPPLKLTPEQTLIARIQDQVAAISNQYASGLVQSVQANFRGSRLIVNISDGWYSLSRSQQDNLAGEISRRTENLDFIKLELVDATGKLLARSPIVGSEMIILKRSNAVTEAA
ncbi:hypothetical protein [Stenomitos frigidus]|uniref:Uncharacterized protein n=1 Tax=Stenomitos frigidus ULC18 TaxID=2107698 RepID=A0A2T1EAQ3_9CYAN|nr:hypothetical protein [Stenomitos frigidus]PSB29781.1 hypothetical protein C7B82_10515 [Stenomitos frigidus ULC18]